MSLVGFLKASFTGLHKGIDDAVGDLTPEQWHWRANEQGLHIAFIVWHYVRTEDNVIQFLLQRKPTIWMDGKWDQKFGLDAKAQGTGMSLEDAAKLRLSSPQEFMGYAQSVWQATEEYLGPLTDADLEKTVQFARQDTPVERVLGSVVMTHGYGHLGEIQLIRGLMGLKGGPV